MSAFSSSSFSTSAFSTSAFDIDGGGGGPAPTGLAFLLALFRRITRR